MFLLIQSGSVDAESGAVYFTFQYVSINTGDLKRFFHVNALYIPTGGFRHAAGKRDTYYFWNNRRNAGFT